MKTALTILLGLGAILLIKYDIKLKRNWEGTFIVWKTVRQDLISGEYYEIYLSKKLW